MKPFPFKRLTCYEAIRDFQSPRSSDMFKRGARYTYISSTLNHYEGIEICIFRNVASGEDLTWHADQSDLDQADSFFHVVPWR